MSKGQAMFDWIQAQLSEGKTVYVQNPLRTIKLSKKHASMIRASKKVDGSVHCEVQMGKRWDSINFCRVSAQ